MKEKNKSGFSGLMARTFYYIGKKIEAHSKNSLKRGLRHGLHRYSGPIDSFIGSGQMDYRVQDILRGEFERDVIVQNHKIGTEIVKVQRPTSNYKIGRYMATAEMLLRHGIERGDINASLTGFSIYQWLGQDQRTSVRNKLQRAYDKAKELGAHYGVPLSTEGDRRMAVMSSDSRRTVEDYLTSNQ